jgi:hypothetical protein
MQFDECLNAFFKKEHDLELDLSWLEWWRTSHQSCFHRLAFFDSILKILFADKNSNKYLKPNKVLNLGSRNSKMPLKLHAPCLSI